MNSKNNSIKLKVAFDLFYTQIKWSLWYTPFVLIVYIVSKFIPNIEIDNLNVASAIFGSSQIYMLVIGIIISFAFLNHYVKNGITRKDYFVGSAIAALGVAVSITVIAIILNEVFRFFGWSTSAASMELNTSSIWLYPIILSLILVSYYVAGWIIAIGIQKFGVVGMFFIPIAILLIALTDSLSGLTTSGPISLLNISFPKVSALLSVPSIIILIGLGLLLIRVVTKDITIEAK